MTTTTKRFLMCERKSTTALNKKWMQWKKRKAFWRWFWRDSRTRKRYVFYVTWRAFVRALRDENTENFARWDRVSLCFSFRCSLLLVAREGFAYKVGFETSLMMNFSLLPFKHKTEGNETKSLKMPIIRHPTPRREHKVRRVNRQHLALPEIRNCSFKEHSNRVESVDGRVRRVWGVDVRVREISVQIFYWNF